MTTRTADDVLVVLNILPALEERIVDWLLARSGGGGFTSFPVSGHSTRHEGLTAAEQVAGQQRRQQLNVQMPVREVDGFLAELQQLLGAADVRFWVLPVMRGGTFDEAR
jgi:hypothetical protein